MSSKIRFAPAGLGDPLINLKPSSKNQTAEAIPKIKELGLDALEIEFVRRVYLKNASKEKLKEIKDQSITNNFSLSIHAPYFINLNAKEEYKIQNSKRYILDSLNVGHLIGAKTIVVHIGYFLKQDPTQVMQNISQRISEIQKEYSGDTKLGIELTGKKSQVGSIDEIFNFYEKFPDLVRPVVDFAHQHARENGYFKDLNNLDSFFNKLNSKKSLLKDLHMHMSGINYTIKGERNHLPFNQADIPYKQILKKLSINNVSGTIVCESPEIINDALLMKKEFNKL